MTKPRRDASASTDLYQVRDGLLAGEYPFASEFASAQEKLQDVLNAGVTCFIDLTEAGEYGLVPYSSRLPDGVAYKRMPINDLSVPDRDDMVDILDLIDAKLAGNERVYMHCWGGVGRTGTVVGCYLMRHGLASPDGVLARIRVLRANTNKAHRESPETSEQSEMVMSWRSGE